MSRTSSPSTRHAMEEGGWMVPNPNSLMLEVDMFWSWRGEMLLVPPLYIEVGHALLMKCLISCLIRPRAGKDGLQV
jgi:hypothetical protein